MLLYDLLIASLASQRTAQLTKQQIKEQQKIDFLKLVQFASLHSPYYKMIIKKYRINVTNCKPEDFPILTKTDVIKHFDQIVTNPLITKNKIAEFLEHSSDSTELFLDKYYVIHTSGSSGTVGYYVYSQKELTKGLANFTYANSLKPFQKLAYVAAIKGHFAGATMASITKKLPLIYRDIQTFDINAPFSEIISKLNKMQPTSISGYPFALRKLAEAQDEGELHITPKILQSGGDPLLQHDKDYIQKVFNAQIINVYAASEFLLIGLGKDAYGGMYLMENNLLFEINATCTLITNLFNYTLPLIRYRMADRLQPIEDTLHILPFTKVKSIIGRTELVPIFINERGEEDFISDAIITEIFIKNITKFQMHLISKKDFVFKVCLEPHIKKTEAHDAIKQLEKKLRSILGEKRMKNVTFSIEVVDHLSVDPKTGKFKLIISHL